MSTNITREADLWQLHSSRVRAELRLPRASATWTSREGVKLRGVTPACSRQKDLLNVAWESRVKESGGRYSPADLAKNFWVDISQAVTRRPWSAKLRPFRGRGHLYSFFR